MRVKVWITQFVTHQAYKYLTVFVKYAIIIFLSELPGFYLYFYPEIYIFLICTRSMDDHYVFFTLFTACLRYNERIRLYSVQSLQMINILYDVYKEDSF